MSMTLTLSPHKTGAQGFGSAKQFIDIYFKYDAKTMNFTFRIPPKIP